MSMLRLQPPASPIHWSAVRDLYLSAFPPEERRPFSDILSKHSDSAHPLQVLCILHNEEVAGFISWWDLDRFAYIEHFAVNPALRGGGLGSRALSVFAGALSVPVVLEVERPGANDMADRRIDFYRRNGFTALSAFEYIQPPYSPSLPAVPMMLMTTDPRVSPGEVTFTLHTLVYGATGREC